MRFRRALTALLSGALLGTPALVATAGSAVADEILVSRIDLVTTPGTQAYGNTFTTTAQLVVQDPADGKWYHVGSGQTVHVQRRQPGESDYSTIANVVTDSEGKVSLAAKAWRNSTRYRFVYDGGTYPPNPTVSFTASTSEATTLRVSRNLHDRLVKGSRLSIRGT